MVDVQNYSLLAHNTFGIESVAKRFVEYSSEEELIKFIESNIQEKQNLFHIGGGSNLLFVSDYEGTILHSAVKGIEVIDEDELTVSVRVGAGEVWDEFVACAVSRDWYGVENLSYIPGEVGASAVQNIGAYGVEAKDFIQYVETVDLNDGSKRVLTNAQCKYSYRKSVFKSEFKGMYAVTHVVFRLSKIFDPVLEYGNIRSCIPANVELTASVLRNTIIEIRKTKLPDPAIQGNAGSFFMNPVVTKAKFETLIKLYPNMPYYQLDSGDVKIPAGWMIEQCGWKGRGFNKAGVHNRQALVLVNLGGASGKDILRLCEAVRVSVNDKFGIELTPEVNIVGYLN
jgi:UDP-N-acetylmuramate dehydrogenase